MATSDVYIGRREGVGLGIEGTSGTAVAPQITVKWMDNDFQNRAAVIENESAMGVVDRVNDSEVATRWAEGTIGGKITAEAFGFLLYGFFGGVSTGTASGGVYPHTFTMSQSSVPATLTLTRSNPVVTQSHAGAVVDSLEITAESGGWAQVSAAVKARVGQSATFTPATVEETEFASKHITAKLASSTAGLAGADPVKASRVTLNLERSSEAFNALGTEDEPEFDRGAFEARGELVLRYTDTQYEEDYLNSAVKAIEVRMANGDDSLTFTASKIRYTELEKSTDRDGVVTQTLSFYCQYDASVGRSIQAVLNNKRATYEAA